MQDFAAWLERKPAGPKPRKPLKRTVRPRQVSKKRGKQNREYTLRRRAYLLEHPWCEAHGPICAHLHANDEQAWRSAPFGFDGHGPASEEIHHKRKPKCKYLNDESTWLAVSRWSHLWIEANKSTARTLGLLDK